VTASIWTVTPSATYRDQMRADLDLEAGTALEYDGTLAGAYTTAAAELAWRVDSGVSAALSTLFLASAPEPVVVARALEAGLTPRPATNSRYGVRVAGAGTLPQGTRMQGGGPDGRSLWQVVDATATVSNGDDITIEAIDTGPVTFSTTTTLTMVTPVTGITGAVYDSAFGLDEQIGRNAESVGSLRVRVEQRRSRGGDYASIKSELLDISWVTAVDVRQGAAGAGAIAIGIVPAPAGADQETELAAALYATTPAGSTLEGTSSLTTPDVNGGTATVRYTEGAQQAVAVVANVISDGTVSDADVEDSVTAAVEAYFATLGPGDPAYFTRFVAAVLSLEPLIGNGSLTLDGGVVDVSPSVATDQLVASPITVAVQS
jgi:hypothetical protein